ncbi:MAG: hypothetical protein K6C68_02810 [Ruminococcus sp.]|nr:hypothetical protein [Ruminococcus sp.]
MYKFKTESYNMKDAASEIFELTKRGWAIISVSPDTKHENDIVVVYRKKIPCCRHSPTASQRAKYNESAY